MGQYFSVPEETIVPAPSFKDMKMRNPAEEEGDAAEDSDQSLIKDDHGTTKGEKNSEANMETPKQDSTKSLHQRFKVNYRGTGTCYLSL